jgi:hypothetical protein
MVGHRPHHFSHVHAHKNKNKNMKHLISSSSHDEMMILCGTQINSLPNSLSHQNKINLTFHFFLPHSRTTQPSRSLIVPSLCPSLAIPKHHINRIDTRTSTHLSLFDEKITKTKSYPRPSEGENAVSMSLQCWIAPRGLRWMPMLTQVSLFILVLTSTVASSDVAKPSSSSNHHNIHSAAKWKLGTTPVPSVPISVGPTRSTERNYDAEKKDTEDEEADGLTPTSSTSSASSSSSSGLLGVHRQSGTYSAGTPDVETVYVRKRDGSKEPLDGNKVCMVVV